MKIALDETLTFEFDPWALEQASKEIETITAKHRESTKPVLQAMMTLLIMGQVEEQQPGTLRKLIDTGGRVAKSLEKPKPEQA